MPNSASFLYYNYPGSRVLPHVDNRRFFINVLLMIEHNGVHELRPSCTVVYPPNGPPQYFDLQPGEMLIFCAAYVPHARSPVAGDETVTVLSLGYELQTVNLQPAI